MNILNKIPTPFLSRTSLLIMVILTLTLSSCAADKEKANKKRSEECTRLLFLEENSRSRPALTPEERALQSNSDVELAYSCSSIDGNSPSCREFYTLDAEDKFLTELCPAGFRKFQAQCSRQNLIGECRIFNIQETRWERRIYARPNDNVSEAQNDCLLAGGKFQDQAGNNLLIPIITACGLEGN